MLIDEEIRSDQDIAVTKNGGRGKWCGGYELCVLAVRRKCSVVVVCFLLFL